MPRCCCARASKTCCCFARLCVSACSRSATCRMISQMLPRMFRLLHAFRTPFETSLHTALHAASCSGCELHMFWRMVRMLCCMLRCMLRMLRRIMCMLRRVLHILCPHAAHVRVELNVAVQLRTFSRCLHMLPRTVLRIMFLSFPLCSHATESACRAHFPQQVFAHSHFMLKLSTAKRSERKACGLCEAKHPRCS